jgi:CRISPR system Cascade subunit CasD
MPFTLLLRLAGPMQSWGTQSRFSMRDTGLEPSKSGVIGLLCAALGRPREDTEIVRRLAVLRMGVRVDREGVMKKDFHTAKDVAKASGGMKDTEISDRWYLADADFLVGLEDSDATLLRELDHALRRPHWQLFLGRKSFVPGSPVWVPGGLHEASLSATLEAYRWKTDRREEPPERLRLVIDATPATATEVRHDVPLSFATRRFTIRYVETTWIDFPTGGSDARDAQTVFVEADSQSAQ